MHETCKENFFLLSIFARVESDYKRKSSVQVPCIQLVSDFQSKLKGRGFLRYPQFHRSSTSWDKLAFCFLCSYCYLYHSKSIRLLFFVLYLFCLNSIIHFVLEDMNDEQEAFRRRR